MNYMDVDRRWNPSERSYMGMKVMEDELKGWLLRWVCWLIYSYLPLVQQTFRIPVQTSRTLKD